jgi:Ser/Thr protein kinase RdoA (MazF antagonist)
MNVSNAVPWLALVVSVASAFFAGAASWISREKLRLDLYNRRFDIYSRTLDFYHALSDWRPTDAETVNSSLQDSPELKRLQRAFIKASREAQFLFDDDSEIYEQLKQMHLDTSGVIGYWRDIAPALRSQPGMMQMIPSEYGVFQRRRQEIEDSIPLLERRMSWYLDFHTLSAWQTMKRRWCPTKHST